MGSQSHGARWRERTRPKGCLLTVCIKHICHICWVRGQLGHGFHFLEGPQGVGGGRAEEEAGLAWPRYKLHCGGD